MAHHQSPLIGWEKLMQYPFFSLTAAIMPTKYNRSVFCPIDWMFDLFDHWSSAFPRLTKGLYFYRYIEFDSFSKKMFCLDCTDEGHFSFIFSSFTKTLGPNFLVRRAIYPNCINFFQLRKLYCLQREKFSIFYLLFLMECEIKYLRSIIAG